jgi:hypothetical protein
VAGPIGAARQGDPKISDFYLTGQPLVFIDELHKTPVLDMIKYARCDGPDFLGPAAVLVGQFGYFAHIAMFPVVRSIPVTAKRKPVSESVQTTH